MKNEVIKQIQQFIAENKNSDEETIFRGFDKLIQTVKYKEREELLRNYKAQKFSELADEMVKNIYTTPKSLSRKISSGFEVLDRSMDQFSLGELVILGGRPGMGKTQFMIQLCANILRENIAIAFFTLDQGKEKIFKRLLSNVSELGISEIDNMDSLPLKEVLARNINSIKNWPLFIDDSTPFKIYDILAIATKLVQENNVKVIMIDYLQLLGESSHRYNREQELGKVTRLLKKLARDLNVVVICSSQLSRQVENRPGGSKRPQLSDLRESGSIEQDADKVLFIYRAMYYGLEFDENNEPTKNKAEIIIAKNRSGSLDMVNLQHNNNFTAFKDYINIVNKINTYTSPF